MATPSMGEERRRDGVVQKATQRSSQPMGPMTLERAALLARSAQMYPEAPAGFHIAAANAPDPQALLDVASVRAYEAEFNQRRPKPKKTPWGTALGAVGAGISGVARGATVAAGAVLPDQAEMLLHPLERNIGAPIGEGLPMLARGAGVVAEAPLQTAVGTARQVTGLIQGKQQWEGWNNFGNEIAAQTTLGQVFEQWGMPGAPPPTGDGDVDLGHGFLPGGQVVEERVEAERQAANLIGNSAWTPGRFMAQQIGLDTDSQAFNVVSGLSDFAVSWFGDPTNQLLKAGGEGARISKLGSRIVGEEVVAKAAAKADPHWKAVVDEAIGLVPGTYKAPRDSVLKSNTAKWLYGDQGKQTVQKMATMRSTTEVWRETGMKWPLSLAKAVADSTDETEIANLLATALTSGVRDLPGQTRGVTGMIDQIVKTRQAQGRLFNMVPDTRIDWDDVETSFRNLNNSAANVGIHGEARQLLMDEFADALLSPKPKFQARYEAVNVWGKYLNTHLQTSGVPDSVAEAATQWTKKLDEINHYDVDDIGHGIGFRPDEGTGPFLVTQLLNTGMYLYSPNAVRKLREFTSSPLNSFIVRNKAWRGVNALAAGYQTELWKPMQLIGPKYLAKALPDERVRVGLGGAIKGPLGWLQTVFGDQYKLTPDGGAFKTIAQKADALTTEKIHLEDGLSSTTAPAAIKATNSRLAEIEKELFDLNEQVAKNAEDVYTKGMAYKGGFGNDVNALYEDARLDRMRKDEFDRLVDQQTRRGNRQAAKYEQNPEEWAIGTGESIIGLSKDPVAIRVARGGLFPGDDPTGTFRPGVDGIIDWLNMGAGKNFREAMEEYSPGAGVGRTMVEVAMDDVMYRTGHDPDLLDAISTGKIKGFSVGTSSVVTGHNPSAELRAHLMDVAENNPDISWDASFVPTEVTRSMGSGRDLNRALEYKDDLTRWFFQSVFAKHSDKLNRSPAFRAFVWRRAEELAPHMDPAEARKMYATAQADGVLPKGQLKSLKAAVDQAAGDLSVDDVNQLAGHAALEDTTDLLFDITNRTQLFDVVRVLMPFGEAWREIITSWGRIIRQNPRSLRRFQQTVNGLRGAGFMYQNDYGEESIGLRGSAPLVSAMTGGAIKGDMSMAASSLNMVSSSVVPGIGPVASIGVHRMIPDKPGTEWIREMLFPYGEPNPIEAVPLPAWANKLAQATVWPDGKTAVATSNQVMNLLYTKDPEKYANDFELLLADTKAVSSGVLAARGIMQAFSPGAPQVRYIAETEDGDVAAIKLVEEFRKMQLPEDEGGEGLDYADATAEFLEKYGTGAALYIVGNTEAKTKGLDATKAFSNFEREEGWLFDTHNEIAGYFGPHGGDFDYFVYARQLEAELRRALTPNERLAAANQVIGNMRVRAEEELMPPKEEWTDFDRGYIADVKSKLEKELFGYTRYDAYDVNEMNRQIADTFDAAGDKRLDGNAAAEAVRQYQAERDLVMKDVEKAGYVSLKAKAVEFQRGYLQWKGEQLSKEVPEFATVWDRLLSREVEPPE